MNNEWNQIQKELLAALIGLARAADSNYRPLTDAYALTQEALAVLPAADADIAETRQLTDRIHAEKANLAPDCAVCAHPCGRTADANPQTLLCETDAAFTVKSEILSLACALAGTAGNTDTAVQQLLMRAVFSLGEDWEEPWLQAVKKDLKKLSGAQ